MLRTLAKTTLASAILAVEQADQYFDLDVAKIEAAVKERVANELQSISLRKQIKEQVETEVRGLLSDQKALEKKWDDLRKMEQQLINEFNQLSLKQKLNLMLEDLQNAESLGELWADSNVDPSLLSKSFDDVTMVFDTVTGAVDVVSDLLNDKGKPMFEWQMTPKTGEVVEISRDQAGKSEKTVNKDVDPIELTSHTAQSSAAAVSPSGISLTQLMQDPSVLSLEW